MLKTALVAALRQAFENYPVTDLARPTIDIEYPVEEASFPNIWVNYADTDKVQPVGLEPQEFIDINLPDGGVEHASYDRYIAQGTATFTIGALSSLERDRLFDQLVRVIEMGRESPATAVFRTQLEAGDYANIGFVYDSLTVGGDNAAPGTPWGTDEMIYEISVSSDLLCEFYIEPETGNLVLLSQITVDPELVTEITPPAPYTDPTWPGQGTPSDL